jgi:hypothetical protein
MIRGSREYEVLIAELAWHTKTLAVEAWQGDEPARQWSISSFPGHVDFFVSLWSENYEQQSNERSYPPGSRPGPAHPADGAHRPTVAPGGGVGVI